VARAGRVVLGSLGLGLLFVLLNGLHFAGSQGLAAERASEDAFRKLGAKLAEFPGTK
jgi:hypothetical protein